MKTIVTLESKDVPKRWLATVQEMLDHDPD